MVIYLGHHAKELGASSAESWLLCPSRHWLHFKISFGFQVSWYSAPNSCDSLHGSTLNRWFWCPKINNPVCRFDHYNIIVFAMMTTYPCCQRLPQHFTLQQLKFSGGRMPIRVRCSKLQTAEVSSPGEKRKYQDSLTDLIFINGCREAFGKVAGWQVHGQHSFRYSSIL